MEFVCADTPDDGEHVDLFCVQGDSESSPDDARALCCGGSTDEFMDTADGPFEDEAPRGSRAENVMENLLREGDQLAVRRHAGGRGRMCMLWLQQPGTGLRGACSART